ncbi:uncharacterized protein C4orf50-like [Dipodomys merriami]|uniref:uncharacterized protein C4orf50-like n=1 Tax=Dipodomys merriami TaxID=94247 RepID=UPI003855947A
MPEWCRRSEEPCIAGPATGAADKLPGDPSRSSQGQVALAQPNPDEHILLLCGCPPGQCVDQLPLPLDSAGAASGLAAPPARDPFLLVQTSTVPLWDLAGFSSLPTLLPQDPSLEELQSPDMLDTRPCPGPGAAAQTGGDCRGARTPHTASPPPPRTGPGALGDAWARGGGGQAERAEAEEARGTLAVTEGGLGDERPSGAEAGAAGRAQERSGALEAWSPVHGCGAQRECPPPASGPQESPRALSGRLKVAGRGRGLPGGLPSMKEDTGPTGPRAWSRGRRPGWAGEALPPQEESHGGPGRQEPPEAAPGGYGAGRGPTGHEARFSRPEPAAPRLSRWAAAGGDRGLCPPRALGIGQDGSDRHMDAFEREVETRLWGLPGLPGLGGARWQRCPGAACPRRSGQRGAGPQQASASRGAGARSAGHTQPRERGEGVRVGKTLPAGTSQLLPAPDRGEAARGLAEPGESPGSLQPPRAAPERAKGTSQQLLAALREDGSQVLPDSATRQGDQERGQRVARDLEEEKIRGAASTGRLGRTEGEPQVDLGQFLQVIALLEDCNGKSYRKISELEEENETLRRDLGRLHRALCERRRGGPDRTEQLSQENAELRGLMLERGLGHKDLVLGIEDMIRTLQGEIQHLLRRVRALERDVALQARPDAGGGPQHARGDPDMARDKLRSADKKVQVTGLPGPPLEEEVTVTRGLTALSLDLQSSRLHIHSTTPPSAWTDATACSRPQGSVAGGEKDEKRPGCSQAQGQARRLAAQGAQCQGAEVREAEEDPWLCVLRLRHQVQTLRCQLRDQGSVLLELQAARDRAACGQKELQATLEELQKERRDSRLATSPLKAKLASLARKCQERNHLITRLLQELGRHGPVSLGLSKLAQSMVHDVALAEYTATFLVPADPEVGSRRPPCPGFPR